MKKVLITMLVALMGLTVQSFAQHGPDPDKESREVKREEREKARAEKQAEFERFVDSLVMSHTFRFLPTDFQMQPAGRLHQISNPLFRVEFYPTYVDICLPYFKGITPPYVITVMNYTVPNPSKMLYEQRDKGWDVSFESSLYSSNNYKFKFSIEGTTGGCTLDIESDFFNTVTYSGTVMGTN